MSEHTKEPWRPDFCPITGRPFFMWIEHYVTGEMVPTYGGPFDSYTIPERDNDGEYICERYDHDQGGWIADEFECVGVQIVSDQLYTCEDDPSEIIKHRSELLTALEKMNHAYVNLMENGRDRIIQLGGECDPVDVMERNDSHLKESRAAIDSVKGGAA